MSVIIWIVIYLLAINIIGFAMMGIDKSRARKRAWRIPEAHLFIVAIVGGSIGSIIGMQIFRHKTRHWYFTIGMPAILVIQVIAVVAIMLSPLQIRLF